MITAERKMNDEAFDDGIEFIYQNTLKVLKYILNNIFIYGGYNEEDIGITFNFE